MLGQLEVSDFLFVSEMENLTIAGICATPSSADLGVPNVYIDPAVGLLALGLSNPVER